MRGSKNYFQSEEDKTKSTEDTLELWNEKPITTEDRWYLSPGRQFCL